MLVVIEVHSMGAEGEPVSNSGSLHVELGYEQGGHAYLLLWRITHT